MPASSVQPSASDSLSTPPNGISASETSESKKQSSMSVTLISGETINHEIPAEKNKSTVPDTSVQPSAPDSLSVSNSNIPVSVTPENKKQSSISVTLASGEAITNRTQPTATDDSSDQTLNTQQLANSSDSPISPDADKRDNHEIVVENPQSTASTASEQPPALKVLSAPQSNISANSSPETKKQDKISVNSISKETIINQTQPAIIDDCSDQSVNTQQIVNTVHTPIPPDSEQPDKSQEKSIVNNQAIANGSFWSRERVKNSAEGHIISEPVSDSSDDTDSPSSHLSEICTGIALVGGAVAVGGVIAGSIATTVIGITAVVVGGTCYILKGK